MNVKEEYKSVLTLHCFYKLLDKIIYIFFKIHCFKLINFSFIIIHNVPNYVYTYILYTVVIVFTTLPHFHSYNNIPKRYYELYLSMIKFHLISFENFV